MENLQKGAYNWNMAVKPETDAIKNFTYDQKDADELRQIGFGAVLTSQKDGIVRGSAAFVSLANAKENECVLKDRAAALYSFRKGTSTQDYPESQTGSIALLRQTYYDAQWYAASSTKTEFNISLSAFNGLQSLPQIFETTDKLNALRADKIGDEFKVKYIIKGSGNEYQRINDIKETYCQFILPLNFPDAFDVEDPFEAELVSLTELKHWEMAPSNPAAFEQNSINFSLTTAGLKDKKAFKKYSNSNSIWIVRKNCFKSANIQSCRILGLQDKIGSLKREW